jgi:hypothetical protein
MAMKLRLTNGADSNAFFISLKGVYLVLSIVGLLTSCFVAAFGGVMFSANVIVPKIARAELAPEIRQISAGEARVTRLAIDLEQRIREGDKTTVDSLRSDVAMLQTNMALLSGQVLEATRVEHELLLRLDSKR